METVFTKEQADELKLNIKMDDTRKLMLYYTNDYEWIKDDPTNRYKCIITEADTDKIIGTQFNKMITNDSVEEFLNTNPHKTLRYKTSYEGTAVMVYNHKDEWIVSTRRCIAGSTSYWNPDKSYQDMFEECMKGKFTYEDLNKDYCYHFNIIHYMNRNNIDYTYKFGLEYKELELCMTTKKYTQEFVDEKLNGVITNEYHDFETLEDIKTKVTELDEINKETNMEEFKKNCGSFIKESGIVIEHVSNDGVFTVMKYFTKLYNYAYHHTPNIYNMEHPKFDICNKIYLNSEDKELNELKDYLYKDKNLYMGMMSIIDNNYKIIADTVKALYFVVIKMKKNFTSNEENKDRTKPTKYDILPKSYKLLVFKLHGIYLEEVKKNPKYRITEEFILSYLKKMEFMEFKQLLEDYEGLIQLMKNFNRNDKPKVVLNPRMLNA